MLAEGFVLNAEYHNQGAKEVNIKFSFHLLRFIWHGGKFVIIYVYTNHLPCNFAGLKQQMSLDYNVVVPSNKYCAISPAIDLYMIFACLIKIFETFSVRFD